MEPIWRIAVRDQRNIGHKPIFAAQSWRTLQAIGWQHAEPVLRSLTSGLLDLSGDDRPVSIGPYEKNLENAKNVREGWQVGKLDSSATRSLLEAMRTAGAEDASAKALELLNQGIAPESLWDAVILSGAELMMRSPGIVAIHAHNPSMRSDHSGDAGGNRARAAAHVEHRHTGLQECRETPMIALEARASPVGAPRRCRKRVLSAMLPADPGTVRFRNLSADWSATHGTSGNGVWTAPRSAIACGTNVSWAISNPTITQTGSDFDSSCPIVPKPIFASCVIRR